MNQHTNKQCCKDCIEDWDFRKYPCPCHTTEDMGWEKEFDERLRGTDLFFQENIKEAVRIQIAAAYKKGQEDMKFKAVEALSTLTKYGTLKQVGNKWAWNCDELLTALNALPINEKEV